MSAVLHSFATADMISVPVLPAPRPIAQRAQRTHVRRLSRPQFFLFGRVVPGWQIVQPLFVEVERDESGTFVASNDLFLVHGEGETEEDALRDYATSLVELFELIAERAQSNVADQAELDRLSVYLHSIEPETGYATQAG